MAKELIRDEEMIINGNDMLYFSIFSFYVSKHHTQFLNLLLSRMETNFFLCTLNTFTINMEHINIWTYNELHQNTNRLKELDELHQNTNRLKELEFNSWWKQFSAKLYLSPNQTTDLTPLKTSTHIYI